ncbi:MAG: threonylcarbamoyl-AMP synthase [Lachnospiraceae bacterium]|jgi:L-threonylcarbamoyladenylate synthase|nr:threonylcarbamoyl-AMP synthase [Lachnospiraceae bacterium]
MNTITKAYSPEAVKEAGGILKAGGLVAFPTETVYGLGADALDEAAAAKIYAAKGRPSDNPLIVHIADIESLYEIVTEVPDKAKKLADAMWPGPLTMIFHKKDIVPYGTTGGLDSVAVRMPDNKAALDIIRAGGGFIAAPSANTSGRPSPTSAAHVAEDLAGTIDMIVDDGEVEIGIESTIVDFTEEIPMILRPGRISLREISAVIGEVRMDPGILSKPAEGTRPKAPGMRYRHYAPKAELVIVAGDNDKVVGYINDKVATLRGEGKKSAVLSTDENKEAYRSDIVRTVGKRSDYREVARNLYKVLREFDEDGADMIYSECFEEDEAGYAIMNRLLKAAGYKIIRL